MKNSKFAKFLGGRIWYMILALLAAVGLWMYVAYTENPDFTTTISEIPVEFEGEDNLTAANLIVTNVSREEVSIRFSGKRNVLSKLNSSNLSVTVDLSDIIKYGSAGTYQLEYEISYPSGVDTSNITVASSSGYITVTVDELVTKTVDVKAGYSGNIADGYQAEPIEAEPDYIEVTGPAATVSQISYAWVELSKDEFTKTVTESLNYTLMDEDGNEISKDGLTFDTETIDVTLTIVMVKEVALTVNIIEGSGATTGDGGNTTVTIEPSSITLVGDAETLESVNSITVGTIDLTKFAVATTETFSIVIPNDVTNQTGETEAVVTVTVTGLSTTRISATNISLINESDGYTSTIITQSLDITLRGPEDELDDVTAENIRIVADMSEVGQVTGNCTLTAKVYVDGFTDVGAVGEYKVSVVITEGTADEADETDEDEEES